MLPPMNIKWLHTRLPIEIAHEWFNGLRPQDQCRAEVQLQIICQYIDQYGMALAGGMDARSNKNAKARLKKLKAERELLSTAIYGPIPESTMTDAELLESLGA